MRIPLYQVDAFTNKLFHGNPAAVCPLEQWPDDATMQQLAAENNLSETAFFVKNGDRYDLRWFTPEVEVDLCGHATLASGFVVFQYLDKSLESVEFSTKSGILKVEKDGDYLCLDFPSRPPSECEAPGELLDALKIRPVKTLAARDYLIVYDSEDDILALEPDMGLLTRLDRLGVIVTAPGKSVDFVSRFFAPNAGIPEDPVTGSAHCTLIPYWSRELGKNELTARQVSKRGGDLRCEDLGDRVKIAGQAVAYLQGAIEL